MTIRAQRRERTGHAGSRRRAISYVRPVTSVADREFLRSLHAAAQEDNMTASRLALGVIASLGLFALACGGDGDGNGDEDATG